MTSENKIIEHLKEIRKLSQKDELINDNYLSILILFVLFMPNIFLEINEKEEG